jgi:hypothetical protein
MNQQKDPGWSMYLLSAIVKKVVNYPDLLESYLGDDDDLVVWWITNHSKASHADRTLKLFVKDEGK